MKAAVLQEVGKLEMVDVPAPKCTNDTILIRVESCAVCGTDVKVYRHGHRLIEPPRIVGHEFAGAIVEVGGNVRGYYDSERVAVAPAVPCGHCYYCRRGWQTMCDNLKALGYVYDGGFAEYMLIPEPAIRNGCVNKVPDGVTLDEAALAEPLACCINAQELCQVGMGQSVLILGAGPIGCMNAQLARTAGAAKVIVADIDPSRLEQAQKVTEADSYMNSGQDGFRDAVMDATEGRGAEVVIVACSVAKAQEQGLSLVAKRGFVDFFGGLPKDNPYINFDSNLLHYREFFVVGNHGSAPRHNKMALDLIAAGQVNVKALITHRFPIDKTIEAIETTERREGLKVIVNAV